LSATRLPFHHTGAISLHYKAAPGILQDEYYLSFPIFPSIVRNLPLAPRFAPRPPPVRPLGG
ncbi:MAG: hypothetical protein FWG14_14355, partial [Peptococcaceae bacterium]|nr:hypothetical protein [Peptococcaceae bacterium]